MTEWIREVLVPECYVRFSVLIADGDGGFANLGVVLVAAVAGLSGVVGLPKEAKSDAMEDVQLVVGADAEIVMHQKQARVMREEMGNSAQREPKADMNLGDDFGTVVDRAKLSEGSQGLEGERISAKEKEPTMERLIEDKEEATDQGEKRLDESGASSEKTKRKREPDTSMKALRSATTRLSKNVKRKAKSKKNAIDDLFKGFA